MTCRLGLGLSSAGALALALAISSTSSAAPVWIGDLETGDTSQWEGVLNPTYIEMVGSPTAQGAHAAKLTLTNDAVWMGGLKRVELNHSPPPARTAEGAELYFAWSFYLESTLVADQTQEIGYWESKNSYSGAMAFEAQGEHILFTTRHPYQQQWQADGVLTAGTWHRIAMHVLWSTDSQKGEVDVWFDGNQVVTNAIAQTLVDDNWHFIQVGLLRDNVPFMDTPVMYIDDAVEGDSLADVHPMPTSSSGAGGAGGGGGASSSMSAGPSSGANTAASSGMTTGAGGAGAGGAPSDMASSGDGGGCAIARDQSPGFDLVLLACAMLALRFRASSRGRTRSRFLP